MRAGLKKTFKVLAMLIMSIAVALVMVTFVACGEGDGGGSGDNDIIQKDYDYVVNIIGTKTQTIYLKSGETLEGNEPLGIPKKSGHKFVGWYADGESQPYDWTRKVNKDLTIRAKFEPVALNVINGNAFPQTSGGIETGSKDTLAFTDHTFNVGSVSATVKPGSAGNDCGIVFGANIPAEGADWENFDYYIVIINRDGYVILSRIDGSAPVESRWNEVANAEMTSFSPTETYKLTIKYNPDDGLCAVFVDDKFCLSGNIGDLPGNSVGYRAQLAGTVFGEITVDPQDIFEDGDMPTRPTVGNAQILSGSADEVVNGGFISTGNKTLLITDEQFTEGSISATVTPGAGDNDCGIIFGADVTAVASWENFDYYTVLLNKDGVLLFAKLSPWEVLGEFDLKNVFGAFSFARKYEITVKYNKTGGYAEIYVDNVKLISMKIGELPGNSVGYRAQRADAVFGKFTIDPDDIPAAPDLEVGGYEIRKGEITADPDGSVSVTTAETLAILKDKQQGNVISFTMNRSGSGDDGIVFCLTDNGKASYWEGAGTSYYFLFVDNSNQLRLARIVGGWSEIDAVRTSLGSIHDTYNLDVVITGNRIECFVNGVKYIDYTDNNKLAGTSYGIRAKATNVKYTENAHDNSHVVIIDGANTTLTYVADGGTVTAPADPEKAGYTFAGWYAADGDTPYDWSTPVTADVRISARFELDEEVKYSTTQGSVSATDFGYSATADNTLMILRDTTFAKGSIQVTVKPGTGNDCGLVFGANVTDGAKWENFDYFAVLINSNGTILFSRVNPWGTMASSAVIEGNFDPAKAHTIKVEYNDGYAKVYADDLLAMTVYIGELKGTAVGFRAAKSGTEFSDTVAVDETAVPTFDAATSDITLIKRAGASDMTVENGVYTSTAAGTLYTSDNTVLTTRGGSVSVKINIANAANKAECNGIIFGVPSNKTTGDLWENAGDNYYFFFISDGLVRLTRLEPWNEIKGDNTIGEGRVNNAKVDMNVEHTLTVSWDGNGVTCFVDGVMYFATDKPNFKLNGGIFGLRAQTAGVEYKDFTAQSYADVVATSAEISEE